jgi:hypothetical protein
MTTAQLQTKGVTLTVLVEIAINELLPPQALCLAARFGKSRKRVCLYAASLKCLEGQLGQINTLDLSLPREIADSSDHVNLPVTPQMRYL